MKTRVISGIVIVLALILVLIPGGYVLFGALFLVSLIAFFELTEAFSVHKKEKKLNALEVSGYLSIIIHYIGVILFDNFTYYIISIMIAFLLIMSVFVIMYPEYTSTQAIYTFFAFIYAPVNVSFIYLLRVMPLGQYLAWIPFIAWVCDTCAYFSGRAFGKHSGGSGPDHVYAREGHAGSSALYGSGYHAAERLPETFHPLSGLG